MEHLSGDDLCSSLEINGKFGESKAASVTEQMTSALVYIHANAIVHGDLKLNNFPFESADCEQLKLVDFGVSWRVSSQASSAARGTLQYMAPEVLLQGHCDEKA